MSALLVFSLVLTLAPPPSGEVVVKMGTEGLRPDETVVYLSGHFAPYLLVPAERHIPLSQKGARFTPLVLPILVGSKVDMSNDDSLTHNVFSESHLSTFDTGYYAIGSRRIVIFKTPGLIDIHCGIQPQMDGWVLVLPSPFFLSQTPKAKSFSGASPWVPIC